MNYLIQMKMIKHLSSLSELEIKKMKLYCSCQEVDDRRRNKVKNYLKANLRGK